MDKTESAQSSFITAQDAHHLGGLTEGIGMHDWLMVKDPFYAFYPFE